jgi:hypothetical protein
MVATVKPKQHRQIQGVMVFVSPLLTCGKAYPWICDKLTLIKRGWEKIHQPENWKIWEKHWESTGKYGKIPYKWRILAGWIFNCLV